MTNFLQEIHVITEEKMIYRLTDMRIMDSRQHGFIYELELVAGYDYINPDENDIQGFVDAESFTEDVQDEEFTVYPMHESLADRLKEEGFTVIDINDYKIHHVVFAD